MEQRVPKHIGIIMDGNRRFAKTQMVKPWMGHEWGFKKIERMMEWCDELGIKELTLFVFSTENFNRPKNEFDFLMDIFRKTFDDLMTDKRLEEYDIRIRFIGRLELFPNDIQKKAKALMEKTKNHERHIINVALGYGGRAELADAARRMAEDVANGRLKPEEMNDDTIKNYLYMTDEPDLIIRTGGEKRTSNFLIYQGAYAEWFFLEKLWPEFEKEDLINVIEEYKQRDRRFGK